VADRHLKAVKVFYLTGKTHYVTQVYYNNECHSHPTLIILGLFFERKTRNAGSLRAVTRLLQ